MATLSVAPVLGTTSRHQALPVWVDHACILKCVTTLALHRRAGTVFERENEIVSRFNFGLRRKRLYTLFSTLAELLVRPIGRRV